MSTSSLVGFGQNYEPFIVEMVQKASIPKVKLEKTRTEIETKAKEIDVLKKRLEAFVKNLEFFKNGESLRSNNVKMLKEDACVHVKASGSCLQGKYTCEVKQLATATKIEGKSLKTTLLKDTAELDSKLLSELPFKGNFRPGFVTINGLRVNVEASDTLKTFFEKVEAQTSLKMSYNFDNDKVKILSEDPQQNVRLGTSADTSNVLSLLQLYAGANKTEIVSKNSLGFFSLDIPLSKLAQVGAGKISINGCEIAYEPSDTLRAIMEKINRSNAGVFMHYFTGNQRFEIQNKTSGAVDVFLQDDSGAFWKALGLNETDALTHIGNNALYALNGDELMESFSNVVSDTGIAGLEIDLLDVGESSFEVESNFDEVKKLLDDFAKQYNELQNYLDTKTAVNTKKELRGIFSDNLEIKNLKFYLRQKLFEAIDTDEKNLKRLSDLGLDFDASHRLVFRSDVFSDAVRDKPEQVEYLLKKKFEKVTTGVDASTRLSFVNFLENYSENVLKRVVDVYNQQKQTLTTKIDGLTRQLQTQENSWRNQFDRISAIQTKMLQQMQSVEALSKL